VFPLSYLLLTLRRPYLFICSLLSSLISIFLVGRHHHRHPSSIVKRLLSSVFSPVGRRQTGVCPRIVKESSTKDLPKKSKNNNIFGDTKQKPRAMGNQRTVINAITYKES